MQRDRAIMLKWPKSPTFVKAFILPVDPVGIAADPY
jgi:hypothetical protein